MLQCKAVFCSVLQYGVMCCSMLQYAAVCCSVLQCLAIGCNALQCVAVCCSVLQCVAVCCSVLQCVAMCCSVLQCVAVPYGVTVNGLPPMSTFFWKSLSGTPTMSTSLCFHIALVPIAWMLVGSLQCQLSFERFWVGSRNVNSPLVSHCIGHNCVTVNGLPAMSWLSWKSMSGLPAMSTPLLVSHCVGPCALTVSGLPAMSCLFVGKSPCFFGGKWLAFLEKQSVVTTFCCRVAWIPVEGLSVGSVCFGGKKELYFSDP